MHRNDGPKKDHIEINYAFRKCRDILFAPLWMLDASKLNDPKQRRFSWSELHCSTHTAWMSIWMTKRQAYFFWCIPGMLGTYMIPKIFMHGLKSAILAIFQKGWYGTFQPMHESENVFGQMYSQNQPNPSSL